MRLSLTSIHASLSLITILSNARCTTASTPKTSTPIDPQQCDCYLISGPDPGYFTHYKLWDFRNASQQFHPPSSFPPTTPKTNNTDTQYTTHSLLTQTPFSKDWHVQTWHRAADPLLSPTPMTNSESNVFLMHALPSANPPPHPPPQTKPPSTSASASTSKSFLVLRTTRFTNHASTAEIESQFGLIDHCSLRLHMRLMSRDTAHHHPFHPKPEHKPNFAAYPPPNSPLPLPVPLPVRPDQRTVPSGTCAGIFTYRSAICESDIEILTADSPFTIHYANQPDYDAEHDRIIPGASAVVNLTRPWTEWTTHRLDWLRTESRWYADDALQTVKRYRVPDRPSIIVVNLWSNGGEWTGDLRVGESVYLGIEWMELLYNLSSS
ncbi:glycoside hydrolase family 16 protein, partial [Aspergillus brunneoviolaceus CBS 621.78]